MESGGGVVRRRPVAVPVGSAGFASSSISDRSKAGLRERTSRPHGWGLLVVLVVLFVGLYACMYCLDRRLPPAGPLEHAAMRYLLPLIRLGPRPAGSHANEMQAVKILLDFLNGIKQNTRSLHRLEIGQQVVSGSFRMRSLNGVTSTYANVQNLVARLGPREGSNHSVMVNCHFDSAINSPGASDDLVSCSVMLEVMRLMSQQSEPLRHSVIFLFNGAEENMLQAAHGFITRHKWSRSIRAYINLEACGAGGRELVFQTGPGHPWLVKTYAESVPYPFANIVGQEVFQSGFIPSDTDFRIFRDHGHIPGLDTAFISNGYVYHTPYDNEQQLTAGSMQRAGENVLAMLRRLTSTDVIVNAEAQDVGSVVFLDVFGMYMVVFPGWLNTLNAYLLSVVVCYSVFKSLRRQNMSVRHGAGGVAVLLASWLAAAAVTWLLANVLDYFDATMSWYSVRYWLVGIYVTATVGTAIVVQQALIGFAVAKCGDAVLCESLLYESVRLVLVGPLLLLAYLNIQSSIALQLLLVFPTVTRSLIAQHVMRITSGWCHVLLHLVGQALPVAMIMYGLSFATELFVPMMGRIGNSFNPELVIGGLTLVCTLLITMYATPLMSLSAAGRRFGVALLLVSGICVATVAFTPFGFPYSTRRPDIRAQRVLIQHVERTFWADDGSMRQQDSGFLLSHQDRNGRVSGVDRLLGLHEPLHTEQFCQQLLYCGMPYYYPNIRVNYRNDYFLGPKPSFSTAVSYAIKSERRDDGLLRLHFNITGPDHMTMQLSPRPGVQVLTWSLADGVPLASVQFQHRPSYFLYFSWGKQPSPWVFWIDVDVSVDVSLLADAVINGHYLHGDDGRTPQLQTLVDELPDWTVPIVFGSALHSFTVRL